MGNWTLSLSTAKEAPMTAPILLRGEECDNLKKAAAMGYDAIEIHTRETADLDFDAIRRTVAQCGTRVGMIVTGRLFTEGKLSLIDDNPQVAGAALVGMLKYVDIAAKLDADIVIGWAKGNIPAGGSREQYRDRLAGHLRTIAAYAGERNVKVCLEVINRYEVNLFRTCQETLDFLSEYDLDNCYIHLDTFHMNIEETDPYAAIRLAGAKLGYVHLADNTRLYPGSGQLDFAKTLGALKDIGYAGILSVECFPQPDGEEAAARSLAYMRSLEA